MLSRILRTLLLVAVVIPAIPAYAQQTGAISGKVADSGGGVLPGVTVEARSDVLPAPRVTTTGANGEYRLPALPPGTYTLTFVLAGMQNVTRQAEVQLSQDTVVDATLGVAGRHRERRGHRDREPDREGLGDHQERAVERRRSCRCRSGRSIATS